MIASACGADSVQLGKPLLVEPVDAVPDGDGPESELSANVGRTLKAYRDAAVTLFRAPRGLSFHDRDRKPHCSAADRL